MLSVPFSPVNPAKIPYSIVQKEGRVVRGQSLPVCVTATQDPDSADGQQQDITVTRRAIMFEHFNHETPQDRAAQKARVSQINGGLRGADGLTVNERRLLLAIRAAGFELVGTSQFNRMIRKVAA